MGTSSLGISQSLALTLSEGHPKSIQNQLPCYLKHSKTDEKVTLFLPGFISFKVTNAFLAFGKASMEVFFLLEPNVNIKRYPGLIAEKKKKIKDT